MPEQCVTSWTVIEPVKDANSPTALHRPMAGSQQHSLSPETCVPAWGGGVAPAPPCYGRLDAECAPSHLPPVVGTI